MVEYRLDLDLLKLYKDMREATDKINGNSKMLKLKIYIFVLLSIAGGCLLSSFYDVWEIGLRKIIVECIVVMETVFFLFVIFFEKLVLIIMTRRLQRKAETKAINLKIIFGEKTIRLYDDNFTLMHSEAYGTYFENERIIVLGDFLPLEKKLVSSENLRCIENIMKKRCGEIKMLSDKEDKG
ncbi:hypothetical protein [[Clostridium] scindens]|uniref:hypothetical protein n=1 Tax=Clostridium scindens (strain JCM 10418 / VPI 12708) TaxID=29347 RepID=UPI00156E81DE|nr:hypothetical protein [[Clostridium] scindens]NSI90387.1 hypothetical protein [[Clostridium] scindens]NSJ04960.1 hypothetical protein [[Clostridium] scindens]